MEQAYQVQLTSFEGPLDLLLQLIEKEKLSITEVSLASVTDQYLAYLETRDTVPLADLANFLSIAAKLILIKSRALLPILTFSEEEEEAIIDLQLQLELYALFKETARELGAALTAGNSFTAREKYIGETGVYFPPKDITPSILGEALEEFLGGIKQEEKIPEETLRKIVTLERRIMDLQNTLAQRGKLLFSEIIKRGGPKEEVIVSFLALLELVKQKYVTVEQSARFAEITIAKS